MGIVTGIHNSEPSKSPRPACKSGEMRLEIDSREKLTVFEIRASLFGKCSHTFFLVFERESRLEHLPLALDALAQRVSNEHLTLVVSSTRISTTLGGNLAETYERLGTTLQQKLMLEKKIDAFTSQGKLQGWVVGALPFGLMAILHMIEPQAMGLIFRSWLGWGTLGFVILLEFMGILFIRKIVNIDV